MLRIHIIYCTIIFILIFGFALFTIKKIYYFLPDFKEDVYVRLNKDTELFNPKNGDVVGYLKKGILLKFPNSNDLNDCDLSDNDRFKILVDLIDFEQEDLLYLNEDVNENIFDENKTDIYYKLDLRKVKKGG